MFLRNTFLSKHFLYIFIFLAGFGGTFPAESAATLTPDRFREILKNRIEEGGIPFTKTIDQEVIFSSDTLPRFYEKTGYRPVWVENATLHQRAAELIHVLLNAKNEGLDPFDYHLAKIEDLVKKLSENPSHDPAVNNNRLSALEILLSDAFFRYGSHLLAGRVNPETIDPEWYANPRGNDMAQVLEQALEFDEIRESLDRLCPEHPSYTRLKKSLQQYRKIVEKGGWEMIPDGPKLEKGKTDPRVALLYRRLAAEFESFKAGAAVSSDSPEMVFDQNLESMVRKFQQLRGLDSDGVVGAKTIAALNMTAEECVRRIEINLERWRWLPKEMGRRYILVNMADFNASVIENGTPVMTFRVIVGMEYRRTPVFSDKISYLVLNPHWYVPKKIAVEDKLPLLKKDPRALLEKGIRVYKGSGGEYWEINPRTINWSLVTPKNFKFKLVQDPGPENALGQVKFMFPNRFNVYLHDTPSRDLFHKTVRTFSSGCIRVENALDLAAYLLKEDPNWSPERIASIIEEKEQKTVTLKMPIPIHLLYWTAFVDDTGDVHFRNDIYGRDTKLLLALYEKMPTVLQHLKSDL